MPEQIIYQGHTPDRVWKALAQRSRDTRRELALRCPVCDAEIHHTTATNPQCLSCDAPVSVYQHRHHTDTDDTRLIYIQVKGQSLAVLRIVMHCLSCGDPLTEEETCTNTCHVLTYLLLEREKDTLYIKRSVNHSHVKREPTEIDIRHTSQSPPTPRTTDTDDTPQNQQPNQPPAPDDLIFEHPNAHTDIAGQILASLTDALHHTATTKEMRAAIGCTTEGFNKARKKLLAEGKIRKVKRGVYALINPT